MGNSIRKEETPQLTDKRILLYDFETFKYNWLVVIIDYDTKEKTVIIDDIPKLRTFYDENRLNIWVGYNSREYDQYILKGILLGFDPWYINNEIISNGKRGWQVLKDSEEVTLYNFDISTGFHSLKQLEGFMGSMIKESDIPFDIDRPLTPDEIEQTVYYCTHDVEETMKVFEHRREEFDSQLLMIEAFDLPMTMFNKTKAQLAGVILDAKRGRDRMDEFDLYLPDTLVLGEKYKHIADWYLDRRNHDYNKSLVANVAGMDCVFAWGGLHAAVPNYQSEGIIAHADVASLYPSLIIEYDLMSRNVSDKDKYKSIRDRRLLLKKEKNPMQAPLKIILNAAYGCFKDSHNPLYDPRQSNLVCMFGQLLILDLVEKIEDKCIFQQINTDGIFIKVDNEDQLEEIKSIAEAWERRTRLNLEWEISRKIVQKDVNNYIIIEDDGEFESKGAYLKPWQKKNAKKEWVDNDIDYDCVILRRALVEYFMYGTPIRDTILSCDDFRQFQKVVKITSLYRYALHGKNRIKEKVIRVFASSDPDASGIFKVKTEDRIEKIANTPDRCFIFNDYCKGIPCPPELDKEYYIQEAEKRLEDFLSAKKSKGQKVKSEIKFINHDAKSAIDAIDQTEYEFFTDLVRYVVCEKMLYAKQIGILVRLNYFKNFGNIKELLRILDIMEFFKYGNARSVRKDKLEDSAYLIPIVSKHSRDKTKSGAESAMYQIEDMDGILHDCERMVLSIGLDDISQKEKVAYHFEYTGNVYPSYEESDRKTLFISSIRPVFRKKDNKQFGYNVETVSLGSGIKGKFTIYNWAYKKEPVNEGDVIRLVKYEPNRGYFDLTDYYVFPG